MYSREKNGKYIRKLIIVFAWLLIWQLIGLVVDNKLLLVGPLQTLQSLIQLMVKGAFWQACFGSLLRITVGFVLGSLLGILLAIVSNRYQWLEEILAPVIILMKAVPVASFVVIILIWWGSEQLAMVISFFIVMPNLYVNTLEGLKSTDKQLLEMAQVFEVSALNRFFYIYRPALKPFLNSAIKIAAGMSWKSGVAAEVIGLPKYAIGEQLYMAKIYLDTAGVLAWTAVIIFLSLGFEKGIMWVWKCFCTWEPACKTVRTSEPETKKVVLSVKDISKSYYGKDVVKDYSATFLSGELYAFHTPSGSGKTTLFRILAGLEKPDKGVINKKKLNYGYLFQEDRLCDNYSAIKNVELVTGDAQKARAYLLPLLEEEHLCKPCKELSGGMKRRVALARAFAAQAELILLDEPYNGLDEENRKKVHEYIERHRETCIVLLASHIE